MALLNNLSTSMPNFLGNPGQQASANSTSPTLGAPSGIGGVSNAPATAGAPEASAMGPGQFNPAGIMQSMGGGMPPQPFMGGMPPMPQQSMPMPGAMPQGNPLMQAMMR